MDNNLQDNEQSYPKQTKDGYYYASTSDEVMGIETKIYENGNETKRITLSDKRIAIVRELKGYEIDKADRLHDNKGHLYLVALASLAVTIDNNPVLMEELQDMKAKDYTKIRTAVAMLNF